MDPIKGKGAIEHALFRELLDSLEPGDVVLANRYYCSYWLIAVLRTLGVDGQYSGSMARVKRTYGKGNASGNRIASGGMG